MVETKEIRRWKQKFRILHGWKISFITGSKYKGQCVWNAKKKEATIYNYSGIQPDDYILHEIIHIAIAATNVRNGKSKREKEELLVVDLCRLIRQEGGLDIFEIDQSASKIRQSAVTAE